MFLKNYLSYICFSSHFKFGDRDETLHDNDYDYEHNYGLTNGLWPLVKSLNPKT